MKNFIQKFSNFINVVNRIIKNLLNLIKIKKNDLMIVNDNN